MSSSATQSNASSATKPPQFRLWQIFVVIGAVSVILAVGTQAPHGGFEFATFLAILLTGGLAGWFRRQWRYSLGGVGVGLAYALLLLPTVHINLGPSKRARCGNNIRQLTLALHNYHDVHGSFPPAYVVDDDGKPLYSWRVLVLPYLEQKQLYDQFRLDEPWDSPHNLPLAQQMPRCFACPTCNPGAKRPVTSYVAITGEETAWPGGAARTLDDFTDGSSRTILLVEWPESDIVWTEPRDLPLADVGSKWRHPDPALVAGKHRHRGGVFVGMADGRVQFITPWDIGVYHLRALLTPCGGEQVEPP
jgi:hypothetical protein